MQIISVNCPNCGAPVPRGSNECGYCGSRVFVTSFGDVYRMPFGSINAYLTGCRAAAGEGELSARHSQGLCCLKLGMYDEAYEAFSEEIRNDFNDSEAYFCAAAAILRGKKPFLTSRTAIDRAENMLRSACATETRGIYLYFLAYIRYDYYERKRLNVSPSYREYLEAANSVGVSEDDIDLLFKMLTVERPKCI